MKLDQMTSQPVEHHQGITVQSEEVFQEGHEADVQVLHLQRQITEPSTSGMSEAGRRKPFNPP